MPHHRFRELVSSPAFGGVPCPCGFAAWPLALSAGQATLVAEVYRLAAALTARQLAPAARRVPEFSRN